jgi:hypothetical protein
MPQRTPRAIVMVTGGAPGVGKTELSRLLAQWCAESGWTVERFDEADIFERVEFAELMAVWARGERPTLDLILGTVQAYIDTCDASGVDVFVQDALFPFLPSLLAWGFDDQQITRFLARLEQVCGAWRLVQIHLIGDPAVAIPRAARREGDAWLPHFIERVSAFSGGQSVVDIETLADYFDKTDARIQGLLRKVPWPVCIISAENDVTSAREARAALVTFLQREASGHSS